MSVQSVSTEPSPERVAPVNGIEIAYDTFGDPADPAMLMIMGLGMQLTAWDPELCAALAGRGFHVIRFDNRDVGHSTKVEDGPPPNVLAAFAGRAGSASYRLEDMARDAAGLLDHLEVARAHVVGVSMGGMIAQSLAIGHRDRVASLCSIMSSTGSRRVGQPRLKALGLILRRAPAQREAYAAHFVRVFRAVGSPGQAVDEQRVRELALASFDRCYYPMGVVRQIVAISASGNRTRALRGLDVPTLVIHGTRDPLVPLSGGRATARAIPEARLVAIEGMGHDIPPLHWPRIVDAIADNTAAAVAP